ncbi:MAG: RluA family pseudouridine synthase [Acidobacteria bacterium]|nr:RluA family pseudouridine synthase [Acidobacteriota bacterium]
MQLEATEQDGGKRLDIFLHERLPDYSRERIKDWVKAGRVLVNGKAGKPSFVLRGTEAVEVEPAELAPLKAAPEEIPIEILYQDEDVVAVNKPAGMVVHEGAGVHSGTLVNAMLFHFGTLSEVGGDERPGIVHRLDRFTSGVLLVARTDAAHRNLAGQFEERKVHKTYLALVHGSLKQDQGRIEKPISRDPVRRVKMTARLEEGRQALTEYKVLRRFHKFTFLEVRIGTGRTHQIRVHLSSLGHPVAGDKLYGAPALTAGMPALDRYFLHAWRIRFRSPSRGEEITVQAPLPAELHDWMKKLEPDPLKPA